MKQESAQTIVFDNARHRMIFQYKEASSLFQKMDHDKIYCDNCLDEIDKVLGFYNCPICRIERCMDCCINEKKWDLELAENPSCIPTPLVDLKGTSFT